MPELKYYYVNLKILVRAQDEADAMERGLDRLRYGAPKIPAEASIHHQATSEEVRRTAAFWRSIERSIAETRPSVDEDPLGEHSHTLEEYRESRGQQET